MFAVWDLLIVSALFVAMLAVQEIGRRLGERSRDHVGTQPRTPGATEAAVYGILGLFLAFSFSGAGARFEARRHLAVEEANAIGTAWLRIDLLPTNTQSPMRELFRQYTDARLDRYRLLPDMVAADAAKMKALALQQQIWSGGIAAAKESGQVPPFSVFLPALNAMIDITATRETAMQLRTPFGVFIVLAILSLVGSLFAGYDIASKTRSSVHTLGFAAVIAMALFVIVDLEFPRLGLSRVDALDSVLYDVRRSMQ
jgi:hypothetical protein